MDRDIPYTKWTPLSIEEVISVFANAPFRWGLAGGYAIEQFLGSSIRPHRDMDILIYRNEQLSLKRWLDNWQMYAADPPGRLRKWGKDEFLPYGVHDIWAHRPGVEAWELQIMLAEGEGDEWLSRRDPRIRGNRDELIVHYNGTPCIRIEIQLLYKAKNQSPKDELDFQACLPLMSAEAKRWLKEKLHLLHPDGHAWLRALP